MLVIKHTDIHSFPQNIELLMVRVFINVWLMLVVFLSNFYDHDARVSMKGKTSSLLAPIPQATTGTLGDGNMELGSEDMGFLNVPNFP